MKKPEQKAADTEQQAHEELRSLRERVRQLSAEIAEQEEQIQLLSDQLARITGSFGWRLLNQYGRFKHGYLLPLVRWVKPLVTKRRDHKEKKSRWSGARKLAESAMRRDQCAWLTLLPAPRPSQIIDSVDRDHQGALPRRPDVICFSIIDWDFRYQRPQQIMSQFAEQGHRVFYISTNKFHLSMARRGGSIRLVKENLYEVSMPARRSPNVYGEVIDGRNKTALLTAIDELRSLFNINEAIGYVMIPSWGRVALEAGQLWNWRIVYDCMDEWENFPGIKRPLLEMERELVNRCDLLIVTAERLVDKWRDYEAPMVLARNGVDYDFYASRCRPNNRLGRIKGPVVGYYGAIADWLDIGLIARAASLRPEYTFVLLGGVFGVDVKQLERLPNVRLLGQQPYERMPEYLYSFDVCMIPFKINAITEATNPVKVYEYLSAGKPVVATPLPELEAMADYVYLAGSEEEFVTKLDLAVAENDRDLAERRRAFARSNTWTERYRAIEAGLRSSAQRASIIIVTYNNLSLTALCLHSVVSNTEYPDYEVIVVDNNSTDGTPEYLKSAAERVSNLKIILNTENRGFACANNQGIKASTGKYLVLLNNDTVVPQGWLTRLLRHLDDPEIGLVGPMTNAVGNEAKVDVQYRTWAEMERFAEMMTWKNDGKIADIAMLAMFCVALRRDTYEVVGPLDEQFGIGMFEDDDYSRRIRQRHFRIVCAADVFVHHVGQAAFKALIKSGEYYSLFDENRRLFELKWGIEWIPHRHGQLRFEIHSAGSHKPGS